MTENQIIVTNHAEKRFKQRVGLPKKACQKHAERAYNEGIKHVDVKGNAGKYLDRLYLEYRTANQLRVYGEFVYLFNNRTLVTVLKLPQNLKNLFKNK